MAVITSPVTGTKITANTPGQIMGLLYADLNTFMDSLSGADITLAYPELERSYGEWGAILREGRIPATSSHAVDKNTTALCGPYYFSTTSAYYDDWTEKVYSKEIRRIELTKVLRGEADYSELLRRIIQSNIEGFRDETNIAINSALFKSQTSGDLTVNALINIPPDFNGAVGDLTDGKGWLQSSSGARPVRMSALMANYDVSTNVEHITAVVWAHILHKVFEMTAANTGFTEDGGRWGATIDDLIVYVPARFMAWSDIGYLQKLNNMQGMNKLPEIKPHQVPDFVTSTGRHFGVAYILDRRVINHVTRYMGYDDSNVNCRKSTQIELHVEDMVKYVPFYKAWAIVIDSGSASPAE